MAVRLQLKLGAVTDQDRLSDSPDTVVVVEPSVGSVARTKGNLYLLVTSRVPGPKAREATRLVAEAVRDEYYYDESAGIRQCLIKVLGSANKKLTHQRDRLGLGGSTDGNGPIGVAMAVVRGREMYVATVGPAEAYLIRQARLSTLPDPNAERGLPANELVPEVWRGELTVGDALCLISANLMARVGTDTLKDALVTLHPQSAVEHVHARFVAADGRGSDGAIAFEATEVGATFKQKTLVPVRPAEPLAGTPDKGPIPLADTVAAGAAAVGDGAARARSAAGNGFQRVVWRVQDMLPRRNPQSRKVNTTSARLETQQRAAVAFLAIVAVAVVLGGAIYMMGGAKPKPAPAIQSAAAAQQAFDAAKQALDKLNGSGQDLIKNDPTQALQLLQTANDQLAKAEQAGYPTSLTAPLRAQINAGLDTLYGVVHVASTASFTFPASAGAVHLTSLVRGSDGAPYVLDTGTKTVWRIDLAKKSASPVYRSGQATQYGKPGDPKFMTIGGPDVLILDVKNVLWRWRPIGTAGKGTLAKVNVSGSTTWGTDVKVIGTFVSNFSQAFYLLYIVQPSAQNIMKLAPNSDGSGYTTDPVARLPASKDVSGITSLLIDGDIYATENGVLERLIPTSGWKPAALPDSDLRPASTYTTVVSPNLPDGSYSKGTGTLYAWDSTNDRVVAFAKNGGKYVAQYMPVAGGVDWSSLQDIEVLPVSGADVPPTMWWVSSNGFYTSLLTEAQPAPSASPSPSISPTPSGSAKPGKTTKPTAKPKATPRPTPKPS
ncbi:MAG TPA: hypothetical protein VIR16_09930 [Candidatus Limnocylindrales bacterium]